jgi:hypothetical protein
VGRKYPKSRKGIPKSRIYGSSSSPSEPTLLLFRLQEQIKNKNKNSHLLISNTKYLLKIQISKWSNYRFSNDRIGPKPFL